MCAGTACDGIVECDGSFVTKCDVKLCGDALPPSLPPHPPPGARAQMNLNACGLIHSESCPGEPHLPAESADDAAVQAR